MTLGNRVEEYWREENGGRRCGIVYAREACEDKNKRRLFAMVTPLMVVPRGNICQRLRWIDIHISEILKLLM